MNQGVLKLELVILYLLVQPQLVLADSAKVQMLMRVASTALCLLCQEVAGVSSLD